MTKSELAKNLKVSSGVIDEAIMEAVAANPSLFNRNLKRNSFNELELNEICRHIRCVNEIELAMIRENIIVKESKPNKKTALEKYYDGNESFISRQKRNKDIHACGNCLFCIGKSKVGMTSKVMPYCRFYDRFIDSFKIDKDGKLVKAKVFEDCCETWTRGEPRLWKK